MTVYSPPADLYPFQSNFLDLDGVRMHYLDEGPEDAPVVFMVHGNPTWSFYYRKLVVALRDRYRCIVPDHIGCGLSDKPDDAEYPYRLERRISDLQSLSEHLNLDQALTLVVHDWGGMIGFGWATKYDVPLARTVVLNTAAFPMPEDKSFPLALWLAGRNPIGSLLVRSLNAFSGGAAVIGFKKPVSSQVRRAYTGPYNSWANRIATLRFVQDIPLKPADHGYDILAETESRLHRYAQKPGLIAWGEKDFVFDHHFLKTWQKHFPDHECVKYPDCGHYILEDGGDELVSRISDFLGTPDQHQNP